MVLVRLIIWPLFILLALYSGFGFQEFGQDRGFPQFPMGPSTFGSGWCLDPIGNLRRRWRRRAPSRLA